MVVRPERVTPLRKIALADLVATVADAPAGSVIDFAPEAWLLPGALFEPAFFFAL